MMYELLYIVPSRFADTEVATVQKQIDSLIEAAGGKVVKEHNLGKIRLAYPIKTVRHGTYILTYFTAEPSVAVTLDAQLRLTDEVLRHTLLKAVKGAETRTYELQSYVAPLSEEDEAAHEARAPRPAPRMPVSAPAPVQAAMPAPADAKPMSIEELDKKLDEILDEDITK